MEIYKVPNGLLIIQSWSTNTMLNKGVVQNCYVNGEASDWAKKKKEKFPRRKNKSILYYRVSNQQYKVIL